MSSHGKQLLVHKDAIKYVCPAGDGVALSGGSDQVSTECINT